MEAVLQNSETIRKVVVQAFEKVFPKDSIFGDSDFFELGGDSMSLVAVCSYIDDGLQTELHPSQLLFYPTVDELTGCLEERLNA